MLASALDQVQMPVIPQTPEKIPDETLSKGTLVGREVVEEVLAASSQAKPSSVVLKKAEDSSSSSSSSSAISASEIDNAQASNKTPFLVTHVRYFANKNG